MAKFSSSPFLSPFYILYPAVLFSWFLVRLPLLRTGPPVLLDAMARWETHSLIALTLTISLKLWQSPTMEAFFARSFFYAQLVVLLLAWMVERRIFMWYCVLFAVIFLIFPQPMYNGREEVRVLTQRSFEENITNGTKGSVWVVLVYAHWSPKCAQLSRIFSNMSLRYSHPDLKFAKVDIGRWPGVGVICGVDTSFFSSALPSLILFEDGMEVCRIPHKDTTFPTDYNETLVATQFELDMRLIKTRSRAGSTTKRGDSSKSGSHSSKKFL